MGDKRQERREWEAGARDEARQERELRRSERRERRARRKETLRYLKAMAKNSRPHPVRTEFRIVKYGAVGFMRNVWLSAAGILVMVVTLAVVFGTAVSNVVLSASAKAIQEKIDITVYMKPGTSGEMLERGREALMKERNVREVKWADSKRELERFLEEKKENASVVAALSDPEMREIVLASMNATMTIRVHDISNIEGVQAVLRENEVFREYVDPEKPSSYEEKRTVIERTTSWARAAQIGGMGLVAIFLALAVLVVFNTIRMAIFSRREEIYMMKLVGAGPRMVRGPFLVEARIVGMVAGLIAGGLGLVAVKVIFGKLNVDGLDLNLVKQMLEPKWSLLVVVAMMGIGAGIGAASARMATRKYLR